jgi:hypothetical protein
MLRDYLKGKGVSQHQVCAHQYHYTQLDEAVLNNGQVDGQPYLVVEHIVRHDWYPVTGNCICTVGIVGGPSRGSAETLSNHYSEFLTRLGILGKTYSHSTSTGHALC